MPTIKVTGLKEFIAKIDDRKEITTALNKGIKKVVFFMHGEVIPLTPIDKGFLRNSYKQKFGNLEGTLYNIRKYAIFIHEGTRFMKGNPFLKRTVDENKKEANTIMNKELIKNLDILK